MRFYTALALALLVGIAAQDTQAARRTVQTETGFQKVVRQLRHEGGVVTLRRGRYGTLTIRSHRGRWLTVRGRPGVTIRRLNVIGSRRVRLQSLRVRGGILTIKRSRGVRLYRVQVLDAHTILRATRGVDVQRSEFARCGEFRACVNTGWGALGATSLRIASSWFHDCYGCDFVRGSIGVGFTLRSSRLERAVPGPCGAVWECNHQDGVQINKGRRILVEGNRFGLTVQGAGQLYFSGTIDGLTIRNNVFFGTDARLPDYTGWAAIVIGHHRTDEAAVPLGVSIVNNTVLTGAPRPDGLANSILLTPSYANIPVEERPLVSNNVLGLLRTPERLCTLGGVVEENIVRDGGSCTEDGHVGDPGLDESGQPLEGSVVIDTANPAWAPSVDLRGWARGPLPDIGAYEYGAVR